MKPCPPRRRVAALFCLQLLLSACSVGAHAPGADAVWPQPQPHAPWPEPQPMARAAPNFQAPSAPHCRRPVRTREVPGMDVEQQAGFEAGGARSPLERWRKSDGGLAEAARPSPPPTAAAPSPWLPSPAPRAEAPGQRALEALSKAAPNAAPWPEPQQPPPQQPASSVVTAGVVDDNADFGAYLAFRERTRVAHRPRDIRERHLLQVSNRRGQPVPDAEVSVLAPTGHAMWARTDAGGRAWLHPDAFDPSGSLSYEVLVRKHGQQAAARLTRGQKSAVQVALDAAYAGGPARLDLVFLVDATGSMADEIGKLKASLRSIADEVARLPSRPDLCFALVAYRDRGDAFLLRSHDFTHDLAAFQSVLDGLQAGGGGDYPEALNEALHETVHGLSWRGDGATRMVLLLADAPPHLDRGSPWYDDDMLAALGKGIKIFSIGASGLDRQGEVVQRQLAQYTGGRFVFLTYAQAHRPGSGPGRETVHDVRNYSVDTLDRLVVRLVSEELAKLPQRH